MKKILFVTSRNPFTKEYSGDGLRSSKIIKFLDKKNKLDVVYSNNQLQKKKFKSKNINQIVFKNQLLKRIYNIFLSLINLRPLQLGFFYCSGIKNYIKNNHHKYDVIIFHLIRSAQYLPADFQGKKILEMTDLMSENYRQTIKNLSIFNPLFYIYFLERYLITSYENYCVKIFDKIVLASKKDCINKNKKFLKKVVEIPNGTGAKENKNIYKYSINNYKIIFTGNINYLPNKIACYDFVKNILPLVNKIFPYVEFHIIGKINFINKIYLKSFKNVKVLGPIENLNKFIDKAICGVSNLEISTGTPTKILTYMSLGLPVLCSNNSIKNYSKIKNKVICCKDNKNFINSIMKLKKNKKTSNLLSSSGFKNVKKYTWEKTLKDYYKLI